MERRNRSLEALKNLSSIDSLDSPDRAEALVRWYEKYLSYEDITSFDLELNDLKRLEELFYRNINFLKEYKEQIRQELVSNKKKQKFLEN